MKTPQVHLLLRGHDVDSLPPALYGSDPAKRVMRLATALAASPTLAQMGPTRFVVRQDPEPVLAIIGEFGEDDQPRLDALQHTIQTVLPTIRYVSYEAAEAACRSLAEQLVERVGPTGLRHSRLRAIPRGGHIVLGLLSYLLEIDDLNDGGGPLIVVDDCAISGVRLRQFLNGLDEEGEIVFAHLYSTPEVRNAIELAESGVLCVAGDDLRDLAPERLGSGHEAWQERWRDRSEIPYWIGQPEHIVFPWNEPDSSFWNPVTNREERSWTLAPADRCLKTNQDQAAPVIALPIPSGALRPDRETLWARFGDRVIIANLETRAVMSLDGSAANMWEALITEDSDEAVLAKISTLYDVDPAALRKDLSAFVDDLRQRRLAV
ncbi:MAG: PqqD family protein [Acidobacteria bacterium]|nr:PqqD family protein [Acidobacteriota bacterium]